MPSKKLLGAAALTAALVGGGVGGALLGSPLASLAQTAPSTTTTEAPAADANPRDDRADRDRDCARGGPGGRGHRGVGADLDAAAEALGTTEDDLRDALGDGKSLADVAGERNVDVQRVIDALVASATARIDDKVADGDLEAADATELKEDLPERVTELVNRDGGARPGGHGHGHGHGRGGPRPGSASERPSANDGNATPSTTTP